MKTAVITGAGRGIGLGLTKEFLNTGHRVVATYRSDSSAKELLDLAKTDKNLVLVKADVRDEASLQPLKDQVKKIGNVDFLINNAGVMGEKSASLTELNFEKVLDTLSVNTIGPMRVTKALLPAMNKGGVIAHVTSLMGSIQDNSSGGYYDYRMSKTALNMFNKSLMYECPQLTCLLLHPGWVQTDMGGSQAPTKVKKSVHGLYQVIVGEKSRNSGEFRDFTGKQLPW